MHHKHGRICGLINRAIDWFFDEPNRAWNAELARRRPW